MAYIPSTYSATLDEALERPVVIGEGGHWEATGGHAFRALVRLQASCACFLGTEIKTEFGAEARDIVYRAAGNYGRFRGEIVRQTVEEKGLPLDFPHMWADWDLPVTEARKGERLNYVLLPHFDTHEVADCPYYDMYRDLYSQELAIAHCEAMHKGAFKGFHPSMETWWPALMPRGASRCIPRNSMPPEVAEQERKRAKNYKGDIPEHVVNTPAESYRMVARQVVLGFHFYTEELQRTAGTSRTAALVKRAMSKWGSWRGENMRLAHVARGWPLDVEHMITYSDDPAAGDAWTADEVQLSPSRYHARILTSPLSEWFIRMATGPISALFFEEVLPAQARAYNPQMTMNILQLKERGDPVSEYEYSMST